MALRLKTEPQRTHRPDLPREVAGVDGGLRAKIRAVVSGSEPWPLFVHGPAGTGKTSAALAVLDYAGGEYHTVSSLCETMNQSALGRLEWSNVGHGGTIWPAKLRERWRSAPLFVLDEIGTREKVSDAHFETVKDLIECRSCKPLIVISNLDLAAVRALYDDRIFSRLAAGTIVELSGADRRLTEE